MEETNAQEPFSRDAERVRCGLNGAISQPCTSTGPDWANVVSPAERFCPTLTPESSKQQFDFRGKGILTPVIVMSPYAKTCGAYYYNGGCDDYENGASLNGIMRWIDMPRDDDRLNSFLDEVATVLDPPEPTNASTECQYCRFREVA
jgi:hypothetical protein